ncbi:hypothetical protein GPA10_24820 [Streptomyces sp. p1417]|uniref:Uncharacterized protein n=1 Tax=Streptomyces typhae TaxID=2681492 RepID=A0A6L6X297_9ACTN|nr:hypothetical protein [Streptomyces typhae]MVO87891.1 hypothetical protein [Streptomyces typhae]
MELTIKVKRYGGRYFAPYITDFANDVEAGCVFHMHETDITEAGAPAFADALTQQARRWRPRPPDAPRGPRIPITMELREHMDDEREAIVVNDRADGIQYVVRADLIKKHAGDVITRSQSERSPDWMRTPARYVVHAKVS